MCGGAWKMEKDAEIPLLETMLLLQSVVLSCMDRRQFPYSKSQLSIFTVLALEGEMTMKQLARYLVCSQEQATRALAPLADQGYVERRTDPSNRTRVYVHLTEEGKTYLQMLRGEVNLNLSSKLESTLTEDERMAIEHSVHKILPLLEKVKKSE